MNFQNLTIFQKWNPLHWSWEVWDPRFWIKPVRSQGANSKLTLGEISLVFAVLILVSLILFIPAINIFVGAFADGWEPFVDTLRSREFLHAAGLTLQIALVVVPLNVVFGIITAWALARHHHFPGRTLLLSLIDLPFSISPVVAGLMLVLLYGRQGWFGPTLESLGIRIMFAFPAMAIATAFVSMPFVAREVLPVLEEIGREQEEAAKTLGANDWQTFWRVTLPSIRYSLLYGIVLTNARAMGEFGAVAVVSGNLIGRTQSLPLYVEEMHNQYQTQSSYSAAVVLACLAAITLIAKAFLERKTGRVGGH